jgi:hypothetical protein
MMSSAELAGINVHHPLGQCSAGCDRYPPFQPGDGHPVAGLVESLQRVAVIKGN